MPQYKNTEVPKAYESQREYQNFRQALGGGTVSTEFKVNNPLIVTDKKINRMLRAI